MVSTALSRRHLLASMAACVAGPRAAQAVESIDLTWNDLLPEGEFFVPPISLGLDDEHGPGLLSQQPVSSGTRTDWNGQVVRLPGFIVPIDYDGTGVTAFILVPYVGACIHVPPPPANQLVFVTTKRPYESSGMFEAVHVTGLFGTVFTSTALADVGYALAADDVRPYRS